MIDVRPLKSLENAVTEGQRAVKKRRIVSNEFMTVIFIMIVVTISTNELYCKCVLSHKLQFTSTINMIVVVVVFSKTHRTRHGLTTNEGSPRFVPKIPSVAAAQQRRRCRLQVGIVVVRLP